MEQRKRRNRRSRGGWRRHFGGASGPARAAAASADGQLIAAYGSAITSSTLQDEQQISYLALHIYESWAIDFCNLPFEMNEHIAKALDRAFSVGVPARHIATGQCSLRNTSKIPMFYINLDHRVDRAANIQKQFEREGLGETFELIRFPAVDGKRRPFTPFEMFTFIEPESLKRYESRARSRCAR